MSSTSERLNLFLQQLPVEAKKSLGQNFLVSDHVVDKIIETVQGFSAQNLIEIGPGPGALTDHLLKGSWPLKLIELDSVIAKYWRDKGCEVIEADALQIDWQKLILNEETILVSNLPYQISSSLVIDRSLDEVRLKSMVLMFQKEVAQRLMAAESTDEYGLLTVIAQNFWKIKKVCEAGPRDFSPAPKVASRVLMFTKIDSDIKDPHKFLKFVKIAFAKRRKQLKSNLSMATDFLKGNAEVLLKWLESKGYPATARAEELSPTELKELYFHYQLE